MASQDWFEKDFYAALGVSKDVSDDELKKTYRKLARQYHPDANPDNKEAEAKFKEISEAYSVLSDPKQRKEYDSVRAMGGARFAAGGAGGGGYEDMFGGLFGNGSNVRFNTSSAGAGSGGFEDILGGLFGGGGFGSAGQYGGQRGSQYAGAYGPQPGRNVEARAKISFAQAMNGATVSLTTPSGRTVKTKIPKGVSDGAKLKLRGKGEPSPNGGPSGDLFVNISVAEHPVFKREGDNLRVAVPVTFAEAALGATVEVPTFGGNKVKVKIKPGTQSGQVLRVKGKGVETAKHTGDLHVEVLVAVPEKLNSKATNALKEFTELAGQADPRAHLYEQAAE